MTFFIRTILFCILTVGTSVTVYAGTKDIADFDNLPYLVHDSNFDLALKWKEQIKEFSKLNQTTRTFNLDSDKNSSPFEYGCMSSPRGTLCHSRAFEKQDFLNLSSSNTWAYNELSEKYFFYETKDGKLRLKKNPEASEAVDVIRKASGSDFEEIWKFLKNVYNDREVILIFSSEFNPLKSNETVFIIQLKFDYELIKGYSIENFRKYLRKEWTWISVGAIPGLTAPSYSASVDVDYNDDFNIIFDSFNSRTQKLKGKISIKKNKVKFNNPKCTFLSTGGNFCFEKDVPKEIEITINFNLKVPSIEEIRRQSAQLKHS